MMRAQPFGKELADFKRQPQQDIIGIARAHGLRTGKDRLDLGVVNRGDNRRDHHRGWNICSCQPPDRDAKKGASCETPFRRCAGRGREPPSSRSYAAFGVAIAAFPPSVPIGIWRGFCASGSSRERST